MGRAGRPDVDRERSGKILRGWPGGVYPELEYSEVALGGVYVEVLRMAAATITRENVRFVVLADPQPPMPD
ncbi:MAG TPA: hypothetical protein VFA00_06930 [Actinomycetota bacterium]|nr:hypothetical protein [Actinomycetota bacterium]